MTQKQTEALETILAALPEDKRSCFREVAEYAVSLGYMPSLKGARKTYADFSKSKVGRTILKIDTDPKFPPKLAVKFFAMSAYTGIFQDAVVAWARVYLKRGYEPRCFGCGKCDGTHGYAAVFPDGTAGFLCGNAVIPLPAFGAEHVVGVKEALKVQDEFFVSNKRRQNG